MRVYPVETHIAEKLHAYTLPRQRPNSRVKDLPDLALLASVRSIQATHLRSALEQTFTFRKTHPLPASVPIPIEAWRAPYSAVAREDGLAWATLEEVTAAVAAFLDPLLGGIEDADWDPLRWSWRRG